MTDLFVQPKPRIYTYEAMFMISQAEAARLGPAVELITSIVTRSGGEILAMRKWDERRLTYEIDKQKRACYILVYFRSLGETPGKIEHEVNLDERIMRVLVVKADHLSDEEIAVQDDRQGLVTEARLRAERGEEMDAKSAAVKLGAPEEDEDGEDDSPEDAAPEGQEGMDGEDAAG